MSDTLSALNLIAQIESQFFVNQRLGSFSGAYCALLAVRRQLEIALIARR